MQIRFITWCWAISLALFRSASAQSFVNLDFEDASIVPDPSGRFYPYSVYASDAMPGWTGYLGMHQVADVLYDTYTLGEASIDIEDSASVFPYVIEGQYTLVLQPGMDPYGSRQNVSASVSQSGLVPADARSLQFKAYDYQGGYPAAVFYVSFAGQILNLSTLGTGSGYTLYGADITSFAGQVGALTITAAASPNYDPYFFDSIVFSPSSVPEPSVFSLLSIGILFLYWCLKRPNNALERTATVP